MSLEAKSTETSPLIALITRNSRPPEELSSFLRTLQTWGSPDGEPKIELEIKTFENFKTFAESVAQGHIPHLLLVEHEDFTAPKASPKQMKPVFVELRRNDPNIAIFMFCSSMPDGNALMNWMDAGVTAFLMRGETGAHLDEALEEILKRRLSVQFRRRLRLPHAHRFNISIPSLHQAIVAETLNIGIGGMFIQTRSREMKVGDIVEFTFTLDSSIAASQKSSADESDRPDILTLMDSPSLHKSVLTVERQINGTGKVVWVRSEAGPGMPEGIGMQFLDLEADGQILLDDFVKKQGTHAFIPKA